MESGTLALSPPFAKTASPVANPDTWAPSVDAFKAALRPGDSGEPVKYAKHWVGASAQKRGLHEGARWTLSTLHRVRSRLGAATRGEASGSGSRSYWCLHDATKHGSVASIDRTQAPSISPRNHTSHRSHGSHGSHGARVRSMRCTGARSDESRNILRSPHKPFYCHGRKNAQNPTIRHSATQHSHWLSSASRDACHFFTYEYEEQRGGSSKDSK